MLLNIYLVQPIYNREQFRVRRDAQEGTFEEMFKDLTDKIDEEKLQNNSTSRWKRQTRFPGITQKTDARKFCLINVMDGWNVSDTFAQWIEY